MIEREEIRYIEGTPVAVRACSIERYVPHYHDDCLELMFLLKGTALVKASLDLFRSYTEKFCNSDCSQGIIDIIKAADIDLIILSVNDELSLSVANLG